MNKFKMIVMITVIILMSVSIKSQAHDVCRNELLPDYISIKTIIFRFTEPNLNSDLVTPLNDLAGTMVYYNMGTGARKATFIPASSQTGGNTIEAGVNIPVDNRLNVGIETKFYAVAIDTSDNESEKTETVTLLVSNNEVKVIENAPAEPVEEKTEIELIQENILRIYDAVDLLNNRGCIQGG